MEALKHDNVEDMLDNSELYQNLEFEAAHQRIDRKVELNAGTLALQYQESNGYMQKLAAILRHHRMQYTAHAFKGDGRQFKVHYFICCLARKKEQKIFKAQVDENLQFIQGLIQQNQLLQNEDGDQPLYMRERKGQVNEHAR